MVCQKEPPQTPKRKSPGGAWRQTERRRNRMTLPIAGRALGLTARRCRADIDTGSAASEASYARPARRAVIRLRRLRSRHLTTECAFFGAPPRFFPTQGKKRGGFVPRRVTPCASPVTAMGHFPSIFCRLFMQKVLFFPRRTCTIFQLENLSRRA